MPDRPVEPFATDRESLERECAITFFVAGGPGGQHRNKVATGVRLVHHPSGLAVTATERRSQAANREAAFERLAERLRIANHIPTPRIATRASAAARTRRLEEKRHRTRIKQSRRSMPEE